MQTFFRCLRTVEFTEKQTRHFSVFLWMIFSTCFLANANLYKRTPEYKISLTCIFGENVDDRRQEFTILDDQSDVALKCSWREGKLYCAPGDGFTYDWVHSDNVTVRRIVQDHEPTSTSCSCFLAEYERPCTAEITPLSEVKGKPQLNKTPAEDRLLEKSRSEVISSNARPPEATNDVLVVLVAVLATMLVVAIITPIIVFVRYRHFAKRRHYESTLPESRSLNQVS